VFTPEQVAADPPGWPATLAGSGVLDLDQVTSGIRERSVWVVSGPPRAGRSMLGVQLARNLAAAGVPVRILLGRDGAAEVVARFRAGSLGRSLSE
jgi:KaiC/GvpD/RAD55 family RecA-like ATPase